MRWARVHIPRKTSEAVRIWQCKWSHFRNLNVSVMGVVRGWHHLTFAAAVPYVPPALNHCARSETIKTTLRDWRCRPHVTGILRVRQLQSQWLHHDSWKDRIAAVRVDRLSVSGQPWEAFPEGPQPLSDQNRKTCNVTFPEAQLFAYDQTQLPFLLLPAVPLLLFQTGGCLILCKLQMCSNLRLIAVAVPSAWITVCTCLPFSFLIISAQRSPPGSKRFLWPPKWKWDLPVFHQFPSQYLECVCVCFHGPEIFSFICLLVSFPH